MMRTMVVAPDKMDVRAEDETDTAWLVVGWSDVRLPEKEKNLLWVVISS
jgi:hypothetical protein